MVKELVNLEEFSYEDYKNISEYIDEAFVLESKQATEVNNLIAKLKRVNSKLEKTDLSKETAQEMKEVMEELNSKADYIKQSKISFYTTIVIITEVVKFIKLIINIVGKVRKFIGYVEEGMKAGQEITAEELDNVSNDADTSLMSILKEALKEVGRKVFSKEMLISIFKEFFSVKNLVMMGISIINKMIGRQAGKYLEYEKTMDKTYEILVQAEAKIMIEKRQAKENKDKYTEECCDKVIEYIEKMKRERVKEKYKSTQESTSILEYSGNEYNLNVFKIAINDISYALQIETENLRAYCNTATYIIRRALEINEDNKADKIELINKKINNTEDFVKDEDRLYDKDTINALLQKYGNMFSTKYSEFGMAAREKFESKLAAYSKELTKIMQDYKDEISIILFNTKGKSINECIDKLSEKVTKKSSYETTRTIKRLLSEVDENSNRSLEFSKRYIRWCKDNLKTENIKNSLGYIIINKLFKS